MAGVTPGYALGRHVSVTLTPLTKASDGSFTNSQLGTVSFNGRVENHTFGLSLTTENISPIHSFNSNPVPIEQGAEFQLTESAMARPDVTSAQKGLQYGNVLKTIAKSTFYVRLQLALVDETGLVIESIVAVCLMTTPFSLNTTKPRAQWSSTLQTISLYDKDTGNALSNPQFVPAGEVPTI